jgi:hypothetical protein
MRKKKKKGGKKRIGVKTLTLQLSQPQGVRVGEKFPTKLRDESQVNFSHLSNA